MPLRPSAARGRLPRPGWLVRAGLAACDATLIAMEAAREGVELTNLEVTVDSDSDASGDRLRELVERAESRSAVLDAITRAVPVTTEIVVS